MNSNPGRGLDDDDDDDDDLPGTPPEHADSQDMRFLLGRTGSAGATVVADGIYEKLKRVTAKKGTQ